jgi:hypothetical protein
MTSYCDTCKSFLVTRHHEARDVTGFIDASRTVSLCSRELIRACSSVQCACPNKAVADFKGAPDAARCVLTVHKAVLSTGVLTQGLLFPTLIRLFQCLRL